MVTTGRRRIGTSRERDLLRMMCGHSTTAAKKIFTTEAQRPRRKALPLALVEITVPYLLAQGFLSVCPPFLSRNFT